MTTAITKYKSSRIVALTLAFLAVSVLGTHTAYAKSTGTISNLKSKVEGAKTTLRLRVSVTPTFTVYKLDNPSRVVVDIVGASLESRLSREGKAVWNVNSWSVGQVSAHNMSKSRGDLVRVVVGLSRPGRYRVNADGKDVVIEVTSKTAPVGIDPAELLRAKRDSDRARKAAELELTQARAEAAQIRKQAAARDKETKDRITAAERMMREAKTRSAAAVQASRLANQEIKSAQLRQQKAEKAEARAALRRSELARAEKAARIAQDAVSRARANNGVVTKKLAAKADAALRQADARRKQAEKARVLAEEGRAAAEKATILADKRRSEASLALGRAQNERSEAEARRDRAIHSSKAAEEKRVAAQRAADSAAARAVELKKLVRAEELRFKAARKLRSQEEQTVARVQKASRAAEEQRRLALRAKDRVAADLQRVVAAKQEADIRRKAAELAAASAKRAATDRKVGVAERKRLLQEASRLASAQQKAELALQTQEQSLGQQRQQAHKLEAQRNKTAKAVAGLERKADEARVLRLAEEKRLAGLISQRSKMQLQLDDARKMRATAKTELDQARRARLAADDAREKARKSALVADKERSQARQQVLAAGEVRAQADRARAQADRDALAADEARGEANRDAESARMARAQAKSDALLADQARSKAKRAALAANRARSQANKDALAADRARSQASKDALAADRARSQASKDALAADRAHSKAKRDALVAHNARAQAAQDALEARASKERALAAEGAVQRELDLAKRARLGAEKLRRETEKEMSLASLHERDAKSKLRASQRARAAAKGARTHKVEALASAKRLEEAAKLALQEARAERHAADLARKEVAAALARANQREKQATAKLAAATRAKPAIKKVVPTTRLREVDVVQRQDSARVVIAMSSPAKLRVIKNRSGEAVLEIPMAAIKNSQERTLDTSSLRGPIRAVSSYRDPKNPNNLKIVVELDEAVQGVLKKVGNTYYWDFPTRKRAKVATSPRRSESKARSSEVRPQSVAGYGATSSPVTQQTVAQVSRRRKRTYRGKKIDLDYKNADVHNLMRLLADVGGVNIVVPDDIKAKVTIRLRRVPWDQALDVILASKGLGYKMEGPRLFRISTRKELDAEYEAKLARARARADSEAPEPEIFNLNYVAADKIQAQLEPLLSSKGRIEVDQRSNAMIINDVAANRRRIIELLVRLDTQTPQIQIEARIVEARSTFVRQFGIQWGGNMSASQAGGNATGLIFPHSVGVAGAATDGQTPEAGLGASPSDFAVNLPAAIGTGSGGGLGLSLGSVGGNLNINLRLSALEDEGTVRIISSPKITTSNNVQAEIKSGVSIPISVISANGAQTQFVPADLSLKVKPTVSLRDCAVSMDIEVKKNEADFVNTGARGDPTLLTKEAKTTILVQDGDTSVIGGIYTRNSGRSFSKVPVLGDIPVFGWLFKNSRENDERTEVLVFITPKITNRAFLPCK